MEEKNDGKEIKQNGGKNSCHTVITNKHFKV